MENEEEKKRKSKARNCNLFPPPRKNWREMREGKIPGKKGKRKKRKWQKQETKEKIRKQG